MYPTSSLSLMASCFKNPALHLAFVPSQEFFVISRYSVYLSFLFSSSVSFSDTSTSSPLFVCLLGTYIFRRSNNKNNAKSKVTTRNWLSFNTYIKYRPPMTKDESTKQLSIFVMPGPIKSNMPQTTSIAPICGMNFSGSIL